MEPGLAQKQRRALALQQRQRTMPKTGQGLAQTLSEQSGAALKGVFNIPADTFRYGARSLVWAANKANVLSDVKASIARDAINEAADNPAYLSDDYNNFLNAMGDKYPNTTLASEVAGSVLSGAVLAKGVKSLGKELSGKVDLTKTPKQLLGIPVNIPKKYKNTWNTHGPKAIGGASAAALTSLEEFLPTLDQ